METTEMTKTRKLAKETTRQLLFLKKCTVCAFMFFYCQMKRSKFK